MGRRCTASSLPTSCTSSAGRNDWLSQLFGVEQLTISHLTFDLVARYTPSLDDIAAMKTVVVQFLDLLTLGSAAWTTFHLDNRGRDGYRFPRVFTSLTRQMELLRIPVPEAVSDAAMRPRVLSVIGGEHIGGSELHLLWLLPYLEGDFRIGICCINGGTRFLDHLRLSAVETFNLGIPDLRSASRVMKLKDLRRVVRRFEPDMVYLYGYTADVLVPIFSLECRRARVVGTRRGQDSKRRHQFLRSLTNPLCDRIVCVSEATAEFVRRTERINGLMVRVIPNGVVSRGRPVIKQRDDCSTVRFGTVGRVMPIKGTDLLLEAFLSFDPHANVELSIAGRVGDPWGERLVEKAAASPHAARIRFVGFEGDPESFLAHLDVFVLPSRSEGMSNALLEAMASGFTKYRDGCGLKCRAASRSR